MWAVRTSPISTMPIFAQAVAHFNSERRGTRAVRPPIKDPMGYCAAAHWQDDQQDDSTRGSWHGRR